MASSLVVRVLSAPASVTKSMRRMNVDASTVREWCRQEDIDTSTLFNTAYMWCFWKRANLYTDVRLFEEENVVPKYVVRYLESYHGN